MRDQLDGEPAPGRLLVEAGEVVAGSMSRTAAGLLFAPSPSAAVRLEDRWAACLREAATAAAVVGAPRERMRAGAALAFATELFVTRARQGRGVRDDGFFTVDGRGRSGADELAEAVVLAARRSADERWVRHLGYLLAEVAVSPDVDTELAGRALRTAAGLGWRQLALLAGIGRRDRVPLPMAPLPDDPGPWAPWGAREDVADLQRAGLLDPPVAAPRPGGAALPRLRTADLRLTRGGVLLHRLLVLEFVRDAAVAAALADLGLPRS